ncbi:MAG: hypothetical protein HC836_45150 [Richelia sp. RM2_1_2]|nr:hypothetical protein [Richelia sp. RM2_1_2]
MKRIPFNTYTQYSFWGNVDYIDNKAAMLERNKLATQLKKQGFIVKKHTLSNQLSKYSGLGQPDGRIGTVYYLDVFNKELNIGND